MSLEALNHFESDSWLHERFKHMCYILIFLEMEELLLVFCAVNTQLPYYRGSICSKQNFHSNMFLLLQNQSQQNNLTASRKRTITQCFTDFNEVQLFLEAIQTVCYFTVDNFRENKLNKTRIDFTFEHNHLDAAYRCSLTVAVRNLTLALSTEAIYSWELEGC